MKSTPGGDVVTLALPVPRSALTVTAAPPELLSQRNVEATVGIPARIYLELLRTPGLPLEVTRVGKLRLVERAAFVNWLRKRRQELAGDSIDGGVEGLAAELGLTRARGR